MVVARNNSVASCQRPAYDDILKSSVANLRCAVIYKRLDFIALGIIAVSGLSFLTSIGLPRMLFDACACPGLFLCVVGLGLGIYAVQFKKVMPAAYLSVFVGLFVFCLWAVLLMAISKPKVLRIGGEISKSWRRA